MAVSCGRPGTAATRLNAATITDPAAANDALTEPGRNAARPTAGDNLAGSYFTTAGLNGATLY